MKMITGHRTIWVDPLRQQTKANCCMQRCFVDSKFVDVPCKLEGRGSRRGGVVHLPSKYCRINTDSGENSDNSSNRKSSMKNNNNCNNSINSNYSSEGSNSWPSLSHQHLTRKGRHCVALPGLSELPGCLISLERF